MGNYVSCALSNAHAADSKTAKVLVPGGQLRLLDVGTTAAEVMLDNSNHFLVTVRSLQVGRRFMPLSADDELEPGEVYILFPMKRVNAVVTAADMGPLLMAAGSAARRASGGKARVIPDCLPEQPPEPPRLKLDDEVAAGDGPVFEFTYRMSMGRSRRPVLETIAEEPAISSTR